MARRKVKDDRDEGWVDELGAEPLTDEEEAPGQAPPRPRRRSLAELSSEVQSVSGVYCPKCHCRDTRVYHTYDVQLGRRRIRICRACGRRFCTTEQ